MVKNYHEIKKIGNITKEKRQSIETRLQVGLGMNEDTEKVSCNNSDKGDESTNVKLPKMPCSNKEKMGCNGRDRIAIIACSVKGT